MNRSINLFFIFLLSACTSNQVENKSEIHEVVLPEASSYPLEIDMSKNATEFITHCQTCHTARYIEMQPKFTRKTWERIVDKMIHSYGAPIDSITSVKIVDYLLWEQDK